MYNLNTFQSVLRRKTMKRSSKLLMATTVSGAVLLGAITAQATDIDVDATMTASAAVSVTKNADLDFGGIDFTAGHIGVVQVGPDGNAALSGDTNLTLTGSTAAGDLSIASTSGIIDITCDATAIIDDGTTPLSISEVKWDVSTATYGAAANTCAGLGTSAVSIDTSSSNNPTILVGAELTIGTDDLLTSSGSTAFDTSTGTGDPVTFRMVFQ